MKQPEIISTWVRGASLALMLAAMQSAGLAQGIIYVTPQQPIYYADVLDRSLELDLNGDGLADYLLICTLQGVYLSPQNNNSVIADGSYLVAALNQGEVISFSLNPAYQWINAGNVPGGNATIGASAIFDGEYFYTGNFSGLDAFIGLQFQFDGTTHYGWMEVNNYPNAAAGQVLGWAYETSPNTPITAGAVPEPSTFTLLAISGVAVGLLRRKHTKN
jgi:hypothetical protein